MLQSHTSMPTALRLIHCLIVAIYLVLPTAVLVRAVVMRARYGRRGPLRKLWLAICGGMVISSAACVASAAVTGGRPIVREALLAAYFGTGLLLLMRGFDRLLWFAAVTATGLRRKGPHRLLGLRVVVGGLLRAVVLFGLGLPYFLVATLTYRPHLAFSGDPQTILHRTFEPVSFAATDGVQLAGWWINSASKKSRQTILLCPGWASEKSAELFMVRQLVDGGYNVLSFDLRGHGQSAGNLVGFGDLERRDVMGAVRWLALHHPAQCRRLLGLGIDTGGAALLAAAADAGPEGQRIDAVAVYGCFDTLANETRALARLNFPGPVAWMAEHVGLPMAAAQLGTQSPAFSPAQAIAQLWPRPVLVLHGLDDQIVPQERGQALFEGAYPPRDYYWIEHAGQEAALRDEDAAAAVKHFFDTARTIL